MKIHRIMMCIATLLFVCALNAKADDLATSEQLHQLFDQGEYKQVLDKLRPILAKKDAPNYDRYDLLTLKGEALLRTKQDSSAADAYREASKSTNDEASASQARATEFLFKRSRNEKYMPSGKMAPGAEKLGAATEPIDVIEKSSRTKAFAALLNDELVTRSRDIEAAKKATTLDPIAALIPNLSLLADVERAAAGPLKASAKTKPRAITQIPKLARDISRRARDLLDGANSKMSGRVDNLEQEAKKEISYSDGRYVYKTQKGLTTSERQELSEIVRTCREKVPAACEKMNKPLENIGSKVDFASIAVNAGKIADHAAEVIAAFGPKNDRNR